MRTSYREKIYECGDYLEVNVYPVYRKSSHRSRKAKPTRAVQQKLNERYASDKLIRICNTNFTPKDYKLDLTYRDEVLPSDDKEAAKNLRNFIRRLKNYRKKNNLPELKYIAVTEKGTRKGRYHHHLIINGGIPQKAITNLWGKSRVRCENLQFDTNGIADLARYMIKDPVASKKRWNASKNLMNPAPKHRDGRLSKRKVLELAKDTTNSREYEKYFPDYCFSEARRIITDINGGVYLQIRYYRKSAQLYWDKKILFQRSRQSASCAVNRTEEKSLTEPARQNKE